VLFVLYNFLRALSFIKCYRLAEELGVTLEQGSHYFDLLIVHGIIQVNRSLNTLYSNTLRTCLRSVFKF